MISIVAIKFNKVLFPQPEEPTIAKKSPSFIYRLVSFNTSILVYLVL